MKIGSLVIILKTAKVDPVLLPYMTWIPLNDETTVYTVRNLAKDILREDNSVAMLEEGIMGYTPRGNEIGVGASCLREIQPPVSSEEIAQLVEDACCIEKA